MGTQLFFYAVGAFFLALSVRKFLFKRTVQTLPISNAASLPSGMVQISGKADCAELLTEPITKKKCVYFDVRIQQEETKKSKGERKRHWETIYEQRSFQPFFVQDQTGTVVVFPDRPICILKKGVPYSFEEINQFAAGHTILRGIEKYLHITPNRQAKAAIIEKGDEVFVLGYAQPAADFVNTYKGITDHESRMYILNQGSTDARPTLDNLEKLLDPSSYFSTEQCRAFKEDFNRKTKDRILAAASKNPFVSSGPKLSLTIANTHENLLKQTNLSIVLFFILSAASIALALFIKN